ncbi:hypothetical protein PV350_23885 [Streptomyces sp. PA03-6a]|nr:hypothetical protein [Streptomyces sp. PA03-6a]
MLTYIVSVRGGKPKSAATSIEEEPLVPFAEVSLPPGEPAARIEAVSRAAHEAPVTGLCRGARPEDDFRFGPRCEEWIVVFIMMTFTLPAAGPRIGAGMIAKIHGSPGRPGRATTVTRQALHA